ncbi:GntR family transcriptional regulator [Nocardioides sp.]|uniref:GntR family transcriptional regulator n=1 Tax=Nocardioides sp. TaxID=35761 RepID=UPI0039E289C5
MVASLEPERSGQSVEVTYARLRAAILSGELAAGSIVTQARLTDVAETGRTPVREALRLLAGEGLVISEANKRIMIAPLTPADLEELELLRISIECAAIRLTVPRLRVDDIARLEGLFAEMGHYQRIADFDRFDVPHRQFHLALVTAMGPATVKRLGELRDYDRRYRRLFANVPNAAAEYAARHAEHREILDRATAGDAVGCARALAAHYGHSTSHIFAELDPAYEPVRLRALVEFYGE